MDTTSATPISVQELMKMAFDAKASDLHISTGTEPLIRINGRLTRLLDLKMQKDDTSRMMKEILSSSQQEQF